MDPRTGKKIRLGRVLRPETNRGIIVAASHGVLSGPPAGQRTREEIRSLYPKLVAADAVMVAPGMVRMIEDLFVGRNRPGLVLELDWKSWNRPIYPHLADGRGEGAVTSLASVEDLAAAGVDAVMTYLYMGQLDGQLERQEVERNARVARECARWGIGLIIEPRSARERFDSDAESATVLSFYCRVSAEIGADIVKVIWPPGGTGPLAEVTESCFVPVMLAGGPGETTVEGARNLARRAMEAGCAGLMFGRKIFQSADPELTLRSLIEVVHGGDTA